VADTQLLKLLSSLEVQFDAAVAREEDEAASDLAFSLRQGLNLRDVLRKGAWVARHDGVERHVVLVGRDFVACSGPESVLIPLRRLVVAPSASGVHARISLLPLVETLRGLCRSGALVEVSARDLQLNGRMMQVGPDHLALTTIAGQTFVALDAIDSIRLVGGREREAASGGL
jgi:hypothetical protein